MEMMKKAGRSVNGASDQMKGNEVIVMSAMLQDRTAPEFVAAELKTTTLVSTLVAVQGALKHASEEMKGNDGIVLATVEQNGRPSGTPRRRGTTTRQSS